MGLLPIGATLFGGVGLAKFTGSFRDLMRASQPNVLGNPRIVTVFHSHDVATFGLAIEMQLDSSSLKLPQHILDAPLDARIVRAIAGNEFLDDGPECRGRQFGVWDTHWLGVLHKVRENVSAAGRV